MDQQLHRLGPLLGRKVQKASESVTTSLSRLVTGGGGMSSKLNFGVGNGGGGGVEFSGDGRLEAACPLFRPGA